MADILGIKPGSSLEEIKKAYREKILIHHPDKGGDPEDFKRVQNAYESLINPPAPVHQSVQFDFSSFFRPQPSRFQKTVYTINLSLADAIIGTQKNIKITNQVPCEACTRACTNCGGSGAIHQSINFNGMHIQTGGIMCSVCGGKGKIPTGCAGCNRGYAENSTIIRVNFEPGVPDGRQVDMDTFTIHVKVLEDPIFKRIGPQEVLWQTKIPFEDSVHGTVLQCPYFLPFDIDTSELGIIDPRIQYPIPGKNVTVQFDVLYPIKEVKYQLIING